MNLPERAKAFHVFHILLGHYQKVIHIFRIDLTISIKAMKTISIANSTGQPNVVSPSLRLSSQVVSS